MCFHFIFCLCDDVDSGCFSFHLHFDGFQHNCWYSIFHSLLERLYLLGVCLLLINVRQLQNTLKQIHDTEQIHSQTHLTLVCLFRVKHIASISLFKDHDSSQTEMNKGYFDFSWFHWQFCGKHLVVGGMFSYHRSELYTSQKKTHVCGFM